MMMGEGTSSFGFGRVRLFPPVEQADEDGLLMVGGQLSPSWLVTAYAQGIFPWPWVHGRQEVLAWYSPDPRAVLELDAVHVSRRLQRRLRSGQFAVTFDKAFPDVMAGCAAPRKDHTGTWITRRMLAAYCRLHELGHAHSVEVWEDGHLAGGLYGVSVGGYFAGESMFHRVRDASKVALVRMVERLKERGFVLFDVQQATRHILSLGGTTLRRREFLRRLCAAVNLPVSFG